jgi:hypothetical protein
MRIRFSEAGFSGSLNPTYGWIIDKRCMNPESTFCIGVLRYNVLITLRFS